MKILEFYRTRTYFVRLLLSITFIVAGFLALFCSVLYFYSRDNAMKLQQEATRKVLRQVNYNVDNLYATVANLTVTTFADRDISALLNSRDTDIFQQYNHIIKLDYIANSNLFVHSLYLYNAYNSCYYITPRSQSVACGAPDADNQLDAFLRQHPEQPSMRLLPNRIEVDGRTRYLLTMLKKENDSLLMVNVKPEWLFDNISAINDLTDRMLGNILIMDADHSIIPADGNKQTRDVFPAEIAARIPTDSANGDFIVGSGRNKRIVMYETSAPTGWKLVSVQSYETVFGPIDKIGTFSLLMFICFLLLAVAVSILIAVKLYKPIGSLLQSIRHVPESRDPGAGRKDEIGTLSIFNERMLEKLSRLQADKQASDSIAHSYYLRRLLLEGDRAEAENWTGHVLKLKPEGCFVVCILLLSGLREPGKERRPAELGLFKFATANVATEWFGTLGPAESVNLGDDQVTFLLQLERAAAKQAYSELPSVVGRIQETLYGYYGITICASISGIADRPQDIAGAYQQASAQSEYRIVYGKSAVLTPTIVAANEQSPYTHLDDQEEKRWLETIRVGDLKKIEAQLAGLFRRLSAYRRDHLLQTIHYLTVISVNALSEGGQGGSPAAKPALLAFSRRVLEQDTLDEMFVVFMELFQDMADRKKEIGENKHRLLADAIKEAIDTHYADPNFSLQSLASMLRMSAAHISKIFKLGESISVADYLNEVRIARAMDMLQHTDATILQIMYDVGFVSESHFYRLFKKSIGLTPREFRTRHVLDQRS